MSADGEVELVEIDGELVAPLNVEGVKNHVAAGWIAVQLHRGRQKFGPAVADRFGVSNQTGRRWINTVAARPELQKREQELLAELAG